MINNIYNVYTIFYEVLLSRGQQKALIFCLDSVRTTTTGYWGGGPRYSIPTQNSR